MKSKIKLTMLFLLAGVLITSLGAAIGPQQPTAQTAQPTLIPPITLVPATPIIVVPDTGDGTVSQTLILFGLLALIVVITLFVVYIAMNRSNTPPGPPPP